MNTFVDYAKVILKSFEFIFSDFLLKALSHENVFKNARYKFNALTTLVTIFWNFTIF